MKIISDNIYFHAPYRVLLANLDDITKKHLNCEIYIDAGGLDTYNQAEIDKINSVFEKYDLSKIVHGPFLDLNPGSRDPKIREVALKRFIAALKFCNDLKTDHIVFHTGFQPIYYRDSSELFINLSLDVWKEVLGYAEKENITIAIENSIEPTPEVVLKLSTKLNSPNFRACFDIGHFNVFGKKSIFECLEEYPSALIDELHLSDNNGDFDSHLALGEGRIDFISFFKELEKKGAEPIITSEPHSMEDIEKNLKFLISLRF